MGRLSVFASEDRMTEDVPTRLLQHFFNISRYLAGHLDFASAIHAVADEIALFFPYDHLDVCMLHESKKISAAFEHGMRTDWAKTPLADAHASPIREIVFGQVDFILAQNAMTDPRFNFEGANNAPIKNHKLRARVHVPLLVERKLIGVLSISSCSAGVYGEQEVKHARYIADLIAPYFYAIQAAENAREAAKTEATARKREESLRIGALELMQFLEHERQSIGMDLHDQTLADITRFIRDIRHEQLPRADLVPRLEESAEELRRIIDMAAPTVLEMFGFAHAVRIHLERAVGHGVEIDVIDEDEGKIDALNPKVRTSLFRIVQESINNAAKHAQANQIRVSILANGEDLQICVDDDGAGLPHGKDENARVSGLNHMRTRAQLLGAQLKFENSNPGTHVEILLPQSAPYLVAEHHGEAQ